MNARFLRPLGRVTLIPGLAVAMVVAMLTLASPVQAQKVKPGFFGMHDSQISSGAVPGVQLGAIRLWDTGTAWRQIETSPGVFDWSVVDAAVNTARAAGLKPMLVLGQTPQFHATNRKAPGAYGPGSTSMPRTAAWTRYVTAAAKRYGTTVDYQIWNEPNVVNYWTGTVAQLASLTATASKAITKAAGRKATVVAPAFPLRLKGQQKWFKKYWASKVSRKGMASYADVVSLNLYPLANQGPEASMKLLALAKKMPAQGRSQAARVEHRDQLRTPGRRDRQDRLPTPSRQRSWPAHSCSTQRARSAGCTGTAGPRVPSPTRTSSRTIAPRSPGPAAPGS